MKKKSKTTLRTLLNQEFSKRQAINPRYSLRAFARFLKIDPSYLSKVLSGRRIIGDQALQSIGTALGLCDQQITDYIGTELLPRKPSPATRYLNEKELLDLSDWYCAGILMLSETKNFNSQPEWISQTLNISLDQVRETIERLTMSGLLEIQPDGRWQRLTPAVSNGARAPAGFQKFRKQLAELESEAVRLVPSDARFRMSTIFSIDSRFLPEARDMVRSFIKRFENDFHHRLPVKDDVYALNLSLFPVTTLKRGEPEKGEAHDREIHRWSKKNLKSRAPRKTADA